MNASPSANSAAELERLSRSTEITITVSIAMFSPVTFRLIILNHPLFTSTLLIAVRRAQHHLTGRLNRVYQKPAASSYKTQQAETFPCPHCRRPFSTKGNLKQHISTVHLQIKPFQCSRCLQKFSSRQTLERHLVRSAKKGACFFKKH